MKEGGEGGRGGERNGGGGGGWDRKEEGKNEGGVMEDTGKEQLQKRGKTD